jgi:hypothetical protein
MGVYKLRSNSKQYTLKHRHIREKKPWNKKFEFSENLNTEGYQSVETSEIDVGNKHPEPGE